MLRSKLRNKERFMKIHIVKIFFLLAIFFLLPGFASAATADPNANAKTQATLSYLTNLPNLTSNKVVSGQHTFVYDDLIPDIFAATGKNVGLMGIDYYFENNSSTNNSIVSWSNAGGLTTIMADWDNPASKAGVGAGDLTNVDFTQLITSGNSLNTTFNSYLDAVATGLQTLQSNNVTVLFRPFHEMNGDWFWWGNKDATQFKNAWIYMFNYLTNTKGLHNLLWVYAPFAHYDMTAYYPGSAYVDIAGMDDYDGISLTDTTDYNTLLTFGKPFALCEYGPCSASGCSSPQDWSPFITSMKTAMPKTVYWMQWAQTWSMTYNTGTSTVLADPWVITRDEINIGSGGDTTPPAAPNSLAVQ